MIVQGMTVTFAKCGSDCVRHGNRSTQYKLNEIYLKSTRKELSAFASNSICTMYVSLTDLDLVQGKNCTFQCFAGLLSISVRLFRSMC